MNINPSTISRFRKIKYLNSLNEDTFRDILIRPLFSKIGLKDGRDLCGQSEEGKDVIFVFVDPLGQENFYAVQTKVGNINLSSKANQNLIVAETQLRTALATQIVVLPSKKKINPAKVILCASGKINSSARKHIADAITAPRIEFYDQDELIPLVDDNYPEFWLGIDAQKLPYLRKLKQYLANYGEEKALADVVPFKENATAATSGMYVSLKVTFETQIARKVKGQSVFIPKREEIPAEAILKKREILSWIVGGAGSGKSTILRRLAYLLCDQDIKEGETPTLPLFLRAVDIAKTNKDIVECVLEKTQSIIPLDKPFFSAQDLIAGNIVLFVDALDEIGGEEETKRVLALVNAFASRYPKVKIIITSRDNLFLTKLDLLKHYKKYEVSRFALDQALKMVSNLVKGKVLPQGYYPETVRRLKDIHGIELSPLLVAVFVSTSTDSRKDIPANITELFKKFTETMLGRWDHSKGIHQQYQFPIKDHLLKQLAFLMHSRRQTSISMRECTTLFSDELRKIGQKEVDIKILIEEIVCRSGLFRVIGDDIEFKHLLIQEFFAGRGVENAESLSPLLTDYWWQRAIIFYFGENPSDTTGIENLLARLKEGDAIKEFQGTTTIGLAIQACYLADIRKKLSIFKTVLGRLANINDDMLISVGMKRNAPIFRFLVYYLFGKDAIACGVLEDYFEEVVSGINAGAESTEIKDKKLFWVIVGLLELDMIGRAKKLTKNFNPSDNRLLLGIYIACSHISNLRICGRGHREEAKDLGDVVFARVPLPVKNEFFKEFVSDVLEVQKGEIKEIPKTPGSGGDAKMLTFTSPVENPPE